MPVSLGRWRQSPAVRSLGTEVVCRTLGSLGVECVFGLPGTQSVGLYEALRQSSIRSVLATSELGAAFMANGYARASGKVGVVFAIPGPGFTFALTGLAEALLDSTPLLLITIQPPRKPGRAFRHQAIDQKAIAGPLVKAVIDVESADEISGALVQAHTLALDGEPGPVLLQLYGPALSQSGEVAESEVKVPLPDADALERLVSLVAAARRPVIMAGQGAADAAAELLTLASRLSIPVVTTVSGRGVMPEDHRLSLAFDSVRGDVRALNELFAAADLVLVLGAKLSHVGSVGFSLEIPMDRLVHVDTSEAVLNANYPAKLALRARVEQVLATLVERVDRSTDWSDEEIASWRKRARATVAGAFPEPVIHGAPGETPAGFFAALRSAMPRDAILVTDSGLHQVLARRHFTFLAPRSFIAPTDFQSMGFGLSAAIGAALAAPDRRVVVVIGDGGMLMAGMELLTAVRERIPLTVIVFNDGRLNLIRLQQLKEYGYAHDTEIENPDFEVFARSLGAQHRCVTRDAEGVLRESLASRVPVLVEVLVGDSNGIRLLQARSATRESVRRISGPWIFGLLKRGLR